jgi:hypothetical protein
MAIMKDAKITDSVHLLCGCYASYNYETEQIKMKHCPLHAAAPAMLEACEDLLDSKRVMHEGHTVYYLHENSTVIQNMKAAIDLTMESE